MFDLFNEEEEKQENPQYCMSTLPFLGDSLKKPPTVKMVKVLDDVVGTVFVNILIDNRIKTVVKKANVFNTEEEALEEIKKRWSKHLTT